MANKSFESNRTKEQVDQETWGYLCRARKVPYEPSALLAKPLADAWWRGYNKRVSEEPVKKTA